MEKKKITRLGHAMFFLFFLMGCDSWNDLTNSGSGSNTNSSSNTASSANTPTQETHGQVNVNLLERSPFRGKDLDPAFWSSLEAYCKAGPTSLIIANMDLIPSQMSRAGFIGRPNAQYYALSRTIAGANWSAGDDPDALFLKGVQAEMDAWWVRYVQAIVQIMQKAPKTTAVIIVNDGPDRCGGSLGFGTYRIMTSVNNRVSMGSTLPD